MTETNGKENEQIEQIGSEVTPSNIQPKTVELSGSQIHQAKDHNVVIENDESRNSQPKVHDAEDYAYFQVGEIDPNTGKVAKVVIMSDPCYIVYLDPTYELEWSTTGDYEVRNKSYSALYGETLNVVARLDAMSEVVNLSVAQKKVFRVLLGMALVAMLGKEKPHVIRDAQRNAEAYLLDRMKEKTRGWYLSAAFIVAAIALVLSGTLWGFRGYFSPRIGVNTFDILAATGIGSIGALISIIVRSNKMVVNLESGKVIYSFEGAMRVVVGMLGALLAALMIKANLILGAINTLGNSNAVMLAICIAAGASEQITPSLVKKVESIVAADDHIPESNDAADHKPKAE